MLHARVIAVAADCAGVWGGAAPLNPEVRSCVGLLRGEVVAEAMHRGFQWLPYLYSSGWLSGCCSFSALAFVIAMWAAADVLCVGPHLLSQHSG
jgi:hypothetical protein